MANFFGKCLNESIQKATVHKCGGEISFPSNTQGIRYTFDKASLEHFKSSNNRGSKVTFKAPRSLSPFIVSLLDARTWRQ